MLLSLSKSQLFFSFSTEHFALIQNDNKSILRKGNFHKFRLFWAIFRKLILSMLLSNHVLVWFTVD